MAEAVHSGAIDVKNREEVGKAASTLLSHDLRSMIDSLKSVQHRRSELSNEIHGLERALSSLKEGKTASESAAHRMETLERTVGELERAREAERSRIEKLFLDNYGRRISIKARE